MQRRGKEKSYALRGGLVFLAAIIGLLLLAVAIDLPFKASDARDHAQRIAGLPDVQAGSVGDTVTVSGTISNGTPLLRGDFVAYRRNQVQGTYRMGTETVMIDGRKQPFAIDTKSGRVLIVNNDYRFEDRFVDWAAATALDTPAGLTEGAITILGFRRSSPVLAVGVITNTGNPVSVNAAFIVAGPRDAYLERLGNVSENRGGDVSVLLAIAALLLLYAIWDGRRIYRD